MCFFLPLGSYPRTLELLSFLCKSHLKPVCETNLSESKSPLNTSREGVSPNSDSQNIQFVLLQPKQLWCLWIRTRAKSWLGTGLESEGPARLCRGGRSSLPPAFLLLSWGPVMCWSGAVACWSGAVTLVADADPYSEDPRTGAMV